MGSALRAQALRARTAFQILTPPLELQCLLSIAKHPLVLHPLALMPLHFSRAALPALMQLYIILLEVINRCRCRGKPKENELVHITKIE